MSGKTSRVVAIVEDNIDAMITDEVRLVMAIEDGRDRSWGTPRVLRQCDKYDLTSEAYVLVLCHDEQPMASKDRQTALQMVNQFFSQYRTNHPLDIRMDLKCAEVVQLMKDLKNWTHLNDYSCLIVIIIGSQGPNNSVRTSDGSYSFRYDIIEHVSTCKQLAGKPKMFIVNNSEMTTLETIEADGTSNRSNKFDMVWFPRLSEDPEWNGGNFLLSVFFDVLGENDHRDIQDVHTKFNKCITDQGCISSSIHSTLLKRLIFGDLRH